jgi:hypothetical protein
LLPKDTAADRYTLGDQTQNEAEAAVQDAIITLYVICDDYLKAMHYRDDPQATMSTAEVMTTALVEDNLLLSSRDQIEEHVPVLSASQLVMLLASER